VFEFVASNGWILLFGAIILFLLWKWISPTLRSMHNSWVETKEEPIDQDIAMSRQAAMFASRERLQNLVQRDSTLAQERSSEREKEKQDRKVEEWEKHRMFGGGINDKSTNSQNNDDGGPSDGSEGTRRRRPFQSDGYNPLMGHGGGGGGYRRTRDVRRGG
jgi:HAMP domain-containing protein